MKYSNHFNKTLVDTYDLKNPTVFDLYLKKGFRWIRKYNDRSFEDIVKDQTIGCTVELFFLREPRCVPINSIAAKKLINKLCYF